MIESLAEQLLRHFVLITVFAAIILVIVKRKKLSIGILALSAMLMGIYVAAAVARGIVLSEFLFGLNTYEAMTWGYGLLVWVFGCSYLATTPWFTNKRAKLKEMLWHKREGAN